MSFRSTNNSRRRVLILQGIGLLNFLAFWAIGATIGGSALLGKSAGGAYFVGDHGRLTQVSHLVYVYSWIHTLSQCVTLPLGVFGIIRGAFHNITRD